MSTTAVLLSVRPYNTHDDVTDAECLVSEYDLSSFVLSEHTSILSRHASQKKNFQTLCACVCRYVYVYRNACVGMCIGIYVCVCKNEVEHKSAS